MSMRVLPIAIAAAAIFMTGTAADAACFVNSRTSSAENIRLSPAGAIVNRLRNGRIVFPVLVRNDPRGRPWVYIEGEYQGVWRRWGYIWAGSLTCL